MRWTPVSNWSYPNRVLFRREAMALREALSIGFKYFLWGFVIFVAFWGHF